MMLVHTTWKQQQDLQVVALKTQATLLPLVAMCTSQHHQSNLYANTGKLIISVW